MSYSTTPRNRDRQTRLFVPDRQLAPLYFFHKICTLGKILIPLLPEFTVFSVK